MSGWLGRWADNHRNLRNLIAFSALGVVLIFCSWLAVGFAFGISGSYQTRCSSVFDTDSGLYLG
jgi:hypothetical protein